MNTSDTPHDYSFPLSAANAIVCLIDRMNLYPSLCDDIQSAAARYGFTFANLDRHPIAPESMSSYIVRHLIIVDGLDCPESVTRRYETILRQFTSATIAIGYSNVNTFELASAVVDRLKAKTAGRVNYLLPSFTPDGIFPSLQKLIDNSICDSVRIKYIPARRSSLNVDEIPTNVLEFYRGTSALVSQYKLFHRAPTDGFISIRSPWGGFYISCTRTDKCGMPFSRVAYVHTYSKSSNILEYSGNYLPSSDSVEAAVVYDRVPWVHAIVHTHASRLFTRNATFSHKIAVPPSTYGDARLGDNIADYVEANQAKDFVILEDHGEFIFGTSEQPTGCLAQIRETIEAAQSNCLGRRHAQEGL